MEQFPNPTSIFHFTHISNLSNIVKVGAILCKNRVNTQYTSAANAEIQNQRNTYQVPVPPYGCIHDYVPFYFNSLSPMLYTIKQGNIQGVTMEKMVVFQTTVQIVQQNTKLFVFTDGHSIMGLTDYYNDVRELSKLDWQIINAKYWKNFPDGKRIRQSEFMIHDEFNLNLVQSIGVHNLDMVKQVLQVIGQKQYTINVAVRPDWFF
ncbi:DUF4433 domain-containing protein [Endozoicomonas sp. SM1973]|uniref:DUF4433 domain-containing protein n=1 Tax=Spartinivicinus marinus TaxID=2994442 RepID=A0A853I7E1_9GAMM|nr:DUF4433 domain-containing protein [Spartinivicinus marinus]NYZ69830.1 DUF4433 domain-containing protein [Spartinivicinus marinus]